MNMLPSRKFMAVLSLFATAGLFAVSAFGQTASATSNTSAPQSVQKLEKFVVTGTNIPTAGDALSVPVTVLGPQQIQNSGVSTTLLDVLRKEMPAFSGNANIGGENATIAGNTTLGGEQVALYNTSTLVLINGRRVAFDPAEGEGGYEFVDLNMIPLSAIQRVEVLTDGASAIYGSDAVGGVVNIILKKDYNGWEAGGHYATSPNDGHYTEWGGSVVGGVSNGTTSMTIAAEVSQHDPIYMKDRAVTNPIYGTSYYPGVIDVYDLSSGHDQRYFLKSGVNAPPGGGTNTIDQLVANGTYVPATATQVTQGFNLADYQTLITNLRRKSAVINFDHKIMGDQLTAFGDVIYANTLTYSSLNGQPLYPNVSTPYIDVQWDGATPPPPGNEQISVSQANNPFSAAWMNQASDGNSGFVVTAHNRFFTFPRLTQADSTLFRTVAGLRGKINENLSWELAGNLNRYTLNFTNPGVINTTNFNAALDAGVINPFARVQAAGVLPGNIIGTAFNNMLSTLNTFDFKVSGTPIDLPAGKLGFALGASYGREVLSASPDVNSIPDANGLIGWAGGVSLQPFDASRKVTAYFAEVNAPVFSPAQDIPGFHSLSFDVAGRYENYTQIGSSSVPKISLRYQPVDEQLTLRASAGKSFSAPILYDLYGPISTGFTNSLTFPNFGGGTTNLVQFQSASGSNPNLKPSTATAWTAGFVYSPKRVQGLSVTFDYRQILQKNLIGSYDQQVVAQSVELLGPASPYASTVHFGSLSGPGITKPGQLSTANPSGVYLNLPLVNLAAQEIKSFDTTIEYNFNLASAGNFDVVASVTAYNSYRAQALPSEAYYQYAGHASGDGSVSQGTLPRWRTFTTVNWRKGGWGAMVAHSYVPAVTDIGPGGSAATAPVDVDSYSQFDGAISYDFGRGGAEDLLKSLKLTVGVNNISNETPPLAPAAFSNTNADISTYNGAIGRMYYVDASYKF